jgi:hypothetical protein
MPGQKHILPLCNAIIVNSDMLLGQQQQICQLARHHLLTEMHMGESVGN